MGSEGYLINQMLAARTNHRTDAWGGTAASGCASRSRSYAGRARSWATASRSSTGSRCSTWSRAARPGTRCVDLAHALEEAGVTVLNTGIGWHEARVPTIITQVPRGRLARGDRPAEGRGLGAGLRLQPDQHPRAGRGDPRGRRGRPGLDGAAAARRPGLRRQGRRGPRRRDQHLHRLQPGLPRPRVRQPQGVVPGQPARRRARPSWCCCRSARCRTAPGVLRHREAARRSPRRGRPAGLAAAASAASAGSRSPCSRRADARSVASSGWRCAVPGKEEFAETLRYFARRLEVLGAEVRLGAEATASPTWRRTTTSSSPPASPRGSRTSTASTTRASCRTPTCSAGRVVPGTSGRRDRCRRDRRRRQPLPDPRPRGRPRRLDGALGRRRPGPAPRRPDRAQAAHARSARSPWCSARHTPIGIGLGKTSGWAHRAVLKQAGVRAGPRGVVRAGRRRRPAPHRRRRAGARRGRPRRALRGPGVRCASLYDELVAAGARAHLIGGADVAAELDAERAIEQGTRVAAALSAAVPTGAGATLDCRPCGSPSSAAATSGPPTPPPWPSSGTRCSASRSTRSSGGS